jgi:hypothetical protein
MPLSLTNEYEKGIKISDSQMKLINLNLIRHDELPLWNYSFVPKLAS